MGLYSKFNVNLKINGQDYIDCRAFYLKESGQIQRIGANEFNNVEMILDEVDVEFARSLLGIDFSLLKTENEIQPEIIM